MKNKTKKLSGISAGIMLSACVSFLVCIYAPFELYLTNISDFWLKPDTLAFPAIIVFSVCFLTASSGFIVARLINEKLYSICLAVGSGGLLSLYIQGTFFVKNLPDMTGEKIDWGSYTGNRIASVLIFIIPALVLLFVFIKFNIKILKKAVFIGSLCFTLLFSVTLASLFITTDLSRTDLMTTVKNQFQMSTDKNVIVLILDSVDSNCFKRQMDADGELAEMLDGFTYYDNALASYPFTSRSLPMILSGKWYENDKNFEEYRQDAIYNSDFITKLKQENYKVGIYERYNLSLDVKQFDGFFDNCALPKLNYKTVDSYKLIFQMAAVKYAPWDLKHYGWGTDDIVYSCCIPDSDYKKFKWANTAFYNDLNEKDSVTVTEEKCAKIIHIEGAHVPMRYDKNLNIIKDGTYAQNIDACITLLKSYISHLKESGVYDNSAIVILADHGYDEDENKDMTLNHLKRMNPLVMIKGINENHTLDFSSAPVGFEDLTAGMTKLVNGAKGNSVFDCSEGDSRTRRFFLYNHTFEEFMDEYITDGRADDIGSMKETGKKFNLDN